MTGNKYCLFENTQKSQADETKRAMSERKLSESALSFNTKGHQSFSSSLRYTSIGFSILVHIFYICFNIDELSSC